MKKENSISSVFKEGSAVRYFLLCILITGLSYGLYKGMLDNYLAEVVSMGEMDRGITEFFRELPGVTLVFLLAVFYMLSAEALFKAGATERGKRTIAKEKLFYHILGHIRNLKGYENFEIYCDTPAESAVDYWRHPYRHWQFLANEFRNQSGV